MLLKRLILIKVEIVKQSTTITSIYTNAYIIETIIEN